MTTPSPSTVALRNAIAHLSGPSADDPVDYRIADAIGPTYLARARSGEATLLIPLDEVPATAGRRGGGFSLNPVAGLSFDYEGRRWEQAAAVLVCTEPSLTEAFLVLVADVVDRFGTGDGRLTWQAVVACVDEWQMLLAHRTTMTAEQQLGLWGELWLIANAARADRLVTAWLGPDRHVMDFFLDGRGLDVKVSREPHVHHVSHRQVEIPVGSHEAYLLSMWVGPDPERGQSLAELVDVTLTMVSDPAALLKRVAMTGYVPVDREQYGTRWMPLDLPRFFPIEEVPRVREIDAGVSQLRYVVTLDPERALSDQSAQAAWIHFCGAEPPISRNSTSVP